MSKEDKKSKKAKKGASGKKQTDEKMSLDFVQAAENTKIRLVNAPRRASKIFVRKYSGEGGQSSTKHEHIRVATTEDMTKVPVFKKDDTDEGQLFRAKITTVPNKEVPAVVADVKKNMPSILKDAKKKTVKKALKKWRDVLDIGDPTITV